MEQIVNFDEHGDGVITGELVRCGECKYRPHLDKKEEFPVFPIQGRCPCECEDYYYSWIPNDDWFCADGERKVQE